MTIRAMTVHLAAALVAGLTLASVVQAQTYPSKTVTLVVPFPAGGSTDWLSRLLGQKLEQRLKQPFIIENRAGGANVIAATSVAKAEPDGHTLLMTTSTTMAINVSVFKSLPYDPEKDFAPVALVSGVPFILVVNAALPVRSTADLVQFAKGKPGGLDYASTGPGSAANLYAVLLKNALGGIAMTPIPYKGNAPGLQDVVAGHVSVMFSDLLSALPLIETGKLRALGVSTAKRSAAAPDIPTLAEAGVTGYDASAWQMIVAPVKTPAAIVDKLNAELHAIVSEEAVNRDINTRGHIAIATPPTAELKTFVRSEIARWAKVVDEAGARGVRSSTRAGDMMRFKQIARGAALTLATLAAAPLAAQDYPARPVTIVVPFAAGGGTDIVARLLAQKLEQRLGKSFLIDNKPGAGSTIGATAAARAAPDGYTLLMAPSPTLAMSVSIYKSLPYHPVTDLIPIALVAQTPFALIVNPSLPIHSVADLIRLAKEKPGQFSYGSAGPGTPHHLYAELFRSMTGVEMSHVPYRGSGPLVNDVVGGHLPLTFVDIPPAVGVIQTGKVRAIAISTKTRHRAFPDIPPVADTVPGFDAASWQMLVAPAKTPRPIVDKLHAEVKAFLPELTERFLSDGMLMMDNSSVEALQDFVKSEIARWEPVVRKAGLTGTQ